MGLMYFLFVLSKRYLQNGVILGEKMAERRGVDDKLLNVPFPSLCLCCVLGSAYFPFFFFFNVFSFVSQTVTCFFFFFKSLVFLFSFFYHTIGFFFFLSTCFLSFIKLWLFFKSSIDGCFCV